MAPQEKPKVLETGIACPKCFQPVGRYETDVSDQMIWYWCPACGHRWIRRDARQGTVNNRRPLLGLNNRGHQSTQAAR